MPLMRLHPARLQRRFHVLQHRQPGEQREALEHDRDVELGRCDGLCRASSTCARRRLRQPRQHAQQRRFTRARRPQQRDNLARIDGQVGGRDHLDARVARLRVVLLDLPCLDDRIGHKSRVRHSREFRGILVQHSGVERQDSVKIFRSAMKRAEAPPQRHLPRKAYHHSCRLSRLDYPQESARRFCSSQFHSLHDKEAVRDECPNSRRNPGCLSQTTSA